MSFNIRYHNLNDGPDVWPLRKDLTASMLRLHRPDVVGLQEVGREPLEDLALRLPEFAWVGVGRDDGVAEGEFAAIFYRPARVSLLAQAHFWLSKTPEVPGSSSWKAGCVRIVTWAKFRDCVTGRIFYFFNTHFDHASKRARRKSAWLLRKRIKTIAEDAPVIVTGDLNCTETSTPYHILTLPEVEGSCLQDALTQSLFPHHGPIATFHAFTGNLRDRIDYIFVANGVQVLQHAALTDHWNGRYPSDHLPVIADLVL
ncbi:MAG: endonuclease/exonuclease/phosphatase family protein [Anaerolineae bacterium]|nr:endonuclease/exonuclease/phosphatase family protein [Anaerolineae bacterium]